MKLKIFVCFDKTHRRTETIILCFSNLLNGLLLFFNIYKQSCSHLVCCCPRLFPDLGVQRSSRWPECRHTTELHTDFSPVYSRWKLMSYNVHVHHWWYQSTASKLPDRAETRSVIHSPHGNCSQDYWSLLSGNYVWFATHWCIRAWGWVYHGNWSIWKTGLVVAFNNLSTNNSAEPLMFYAR